MAPLLLYLKCRLQVSSIQKARHLWKEPEARKHYPAPVPQLLQLLLVARSAQLRHDLGHRPYDHCHLRLLALHCREVVLRQRMDLSRPGSLATLGQEGCLG